MLTLATSVGFGVAGIMLMFTYESLKQYAVLKAISATPRGLLLMVLVESGTRAAIGTGIGIGLCSLPGELVSAAGYPLRVMWFTLLAGTLGVRTTSRPTPYAGVKAREPNSSRSAPSHRRVSRYEATARMSAAMRPCSITFITEASGRSSVRRNTVICLMT